MADKDHISEDLKTMWADHFHMRDQSWKALSNTLLVFIAVSGLHIAEPIDSRALAVADGALVVIAMVGLVVARHHRARQSEKFGIIKRYEAALGLSEIKFPPAAPAQVTRRRGQVFHTATFIVVAEATLVATGLGLLLSTVFG